METRGSANTAPGQGPSLELIELGSTGVWVPTVSLRGIDSATGDLTDITVTNGKIEVDAGSIAGDATNAKLDQLRANVDAATAAISTLFTDAHGVALSSKIDILTQDTASLNGQAVNSPAAVGLIAFDGTNYRRLLTDAGANLYIRSANFPVPNADAQTSLNGSIACYAFNGTNFDRVKTVTAAQGTTGTGLLGVGSLVYDGTNWIRPLTAFQYNGQSAIAPPGVGLMGFDGSSYRRVNVDGSGFTQIKWGGGLVNAPADGSAQIGGATVLQVLNSGGNYDKLRSVESAQGTAGTGLLGTGLLSYNGTNWVRNLTTDQYNAQSTVIPPGVGVMGLDTGGNYRRFLTSTAGQLIVIGSGSAADTVSTSGLIPNANLVFNGTTFDRVRSASAAVSTTGTGLLGVGNLIANGSTWEVWSAQGSDASGGLFPRVGVGVYNGSTMDRLRGAEGAQGGTGTGLLGVSSLLWDGTVYQRPYSESGRAGDGLGGTGIVPNAIHVYNGTNYDRLKGSTTQTGRLLTQNMWEPDTKTTGALTAVAQTVSLALPQGANQIMADFGVSGVGTIVLEVSFDSGTSWRPITAGRGDTTTTQVTALNSVNTWCEAASPAGATNVRLRCSVYTSGTIAPTLAVGQGAYEPAPTVGIGSSLQAGTQSIGYTPVLGSWWDDTSTPLAAAGTYTGTSRDLTGGVGSGSALGVTHRSSEARFAAVSDQLGKLCLEVSRDNSTWRRVKEVTMSTTGTGGLYTAEINYLPYTRYLRVVFVNDATLQTHFMLQSMLMAG